MTDIEWAAQLISDISGGVHLFNTERSIQFAQVLLLKSIAQSLEKLTGRQKREGNIPNHSSQRP